ncbi:MAG: putative bifunctional diguanylate cyclase/phosphodiesterase [Jatrophihabitantaceae bacterium]
MRDPEGLVIAEWPRLVRFASRWPRRVRRIVAVALVINVALGMAFSIIGLRRQGDARSGVQVQLTQRVAAANDIRADVWRSVARGSVSPLLARADLTTVASWTAGTQHAGSAAGHDTGAAFAASVQSVRTALAAGDLARARADALVIDADLVTLRQALTSASAAHLRSSERAGTTADIETIVLMLFAALMGLVLFQRTAAARINGDLRAARERARAEARFGSLVRHSSDLISIVDIDFTIAYQTPSLESVLGYAAGELVGTRLLELVHPADALHLVAAHDALLDGADPLPTTVRVQAADGTWRHIENVHNDMRDDETVAGIVVTSRDVSERVALEEQLRHSALHDDLTGLANRVLFADRVEHAMSRRVGVTTTPAVIFLDLDDFKAVNDALGHRVGDELLVVVAQRLSAGVRDSDTVARLGGDEFAVLVEDLDAASCARMLQRVQESLRRPVELDGRELTVRASLGIARAVTATDAGSLLANADLAMYAAKAAGKDTLLEFTADLGEDALRRLQIKTELQQALRVGEIRTYFQPTVTLATGELSGFEALVRWEHPRRGTVAPLEFIPLAEQTGQIVQIGRHVLRDACQSLAGWHRAHPQYAHLTVAVNLSARELQEPDLVQAVTAELSRSGLAPDKLTLEVTESLFMTDTVQAKRQLAALRSIGVLVAIDDFGTGYSSLSYLEELPADIVKIDKSFVDRLTTGQPNVLVETITQLGAALGLRTVAEGIEHNSQAEILRELGCDLGQGYLYSRPVPPHEIDALLGIRRPMARRRVPTGAVRVA